MSSVGEVKTKKLEYTLRSAIDMRLQECPYTSCHGSYAWSHRIRYFLSYQIMDAFSYCDSSVRTSLFDAVDIFNWHKKVIVNRCFIIQVIAEYNATLIDRISVIRCLARPRDGY